MRFWKKKFDSGDGLWPDEILLDATNMPGYSQERFEGVLEKPISKGAFFSFGLLLLLFGITFVSRSAWLQVVRGDELEHRAVDNYIAKTYIDPPRGIIYDRNGAIIVSNEAYTDEKGEIQYRRKIRHSFAFSHIVGFVGRPSEEDMAEGLSQEGIKNLGKTGLEQKYNELLRGVPGERDRELDAVGNVISEGLIKPTKEGENITTTLNADLQEFFWTAIEQTTRERSFHGGAGVVYDLRDGAILSIVSVPSFDLNAFSAGLSSLEAKRLFEDPRSPLFNRAVSGVYTPGSIMKPFYALAALHENVISPEREVYSSGALRVPDPYRPGSFSTFLDWKAHGYVDMRRAIAVSSNVYFFTVGGGFGDVKGLGITRMKEFLSKFGFGGSPTGIDVAGEETGFIPDPEWKKTAKPSNPTWRLGDSYNVSIGQGDLSVTLLEVARGLGILATRGTVLAPYLQKDDVPHLPKEKIATFSDAHYQIIAEGMAQATESHGTAAAVAGLPIEIAAKTGTAEIGNKDRVNSWFMGYAPRSDPKVGIVILMESGPRANLVGASYIARQTFDWILTHGGVDSLVNSSH